MASPAKPPAKKGMNLTKKVGPLPVWAWAAITLIGGYLLYEHYKGTSSGTTSTTSAAAPAADPNASPSGSGSGSSGTPDTSATTPYTGPYGHQGFSDQSSQLLSALGAETAALANLNAGGNGSAQGPTTNNYYGTSPDTSSGANGSALGGATPATLAKADQAAAVSAAKTSLDNTTTPIASQAAAAAAKQGGNVAFNTKIDTAALLGQVYTGAPANSAPAAKAKVSTTASGAAATKAKAAPVNTQAAKNTRAG